MNQLPQRGEKLFSDRRLNTNPTQRVKLPWEANRPYRILSLDGGGIRGLYGACLLSKIEESLTGGRPIASFFDAIAGTSTGGIMASALGLNIKADRIKSLYQVEGKEIFHQPKLWSIPLIKVFRHLRRSLYNHEVLEKLLYREFSDRTYGESVSRLIIPAFIGPRTEIAVFKTDHHPDYKKDYKSKVWEIARATSAAPTFLQGHRNGDVVFLDGGVWANNPVMVAIVDALSAYDLSPKQFQILSIGTGNIPFDVTLGGVFGGLWGWKEIIKAAMFLTTDNAHAQAALLIGPQNILRLEPSSQAAGIELDDWQSSSRLFPDMALHDFETHKEELKRFFYDPVPPRDRFYT